MSLNHTVQKPNCRLKQINFIPNLSHDAELNTSNLIAFCVPDCGADSFKVLFYEPLLKM